MRTLKDTYKSPTLPMNFDFDIFISIIYSEEKMQKLKNVIFLTVLVLFAGCSGIEVSQDYNMNVNFSNLKTFNWYSAKQKKTNDLRVDNLLLDSRIRKAVDRSLAQKGYQQILCQFFFKIFIFPEFDP